MTFTTDQEELRRYARQWLDDKAPLEMVRQTMDTDAGFEPALWKEMGELGWLGIAVPEEHGGAGYGFGEVAVLGEEMGRGLFGSPFLSSVVMGTTLVQALGTPEQVDELVPPLVSGDKRLSVALVDGGGRAADGFDTGVIGGNGGWTITGSKRFVVDGHTADTVLVAASTDAGVVVLMVDGDAAGLTRTRLDTMDLTRPLADLDFDGVPAIQLGEEGPGAAAALGSMLDRAVGYLAMEQVGGARACLDMAVEYAQTRHQFGRAIGSFQAVKHMCAEMLVEVESAKSAAYHLAAALDNDPSEVPVAARLAKSYCSEAFFRCAADTIQIHGGIGFTWEHNAHLYFKRAKSSELMFGDPAEHRRRLADLLEI